MRFSEAQAIVGRITYKSGWRLSLTEDFNSFGANLCVSFLGPDATLVEPRDIQIRGSYPVHLEQVRGESDLIGQVRRILQRMEQHETDEWLKLDGVAPFYPH